MTSPRSALFVIDIQNELAADPQTEIPHASRVREVGGKILSAARGLAALPGKMPTLIVFVQHEEPPEDGTLIRGSEAWKLVFNPLADADCEILIAKNTGKYPIFTGSDAKSDVN
jgi:nicotinamidase-related amidase